jgi:hypothetical protein
MSDTTRTRLLSDIRTQFYTVALLLLAALFVAGLAGTRTHVPFSSAEVQFTDASAHGMQIVPASCPSSPHYVGECSGVCPAGYSGTPPLCSLITGGGGPGGGGPPGMNCPNGAYDYPYCTHFTVNCPSGYVGMPPNCTPTIPFTPIDSIQFITFDATNPHGSFRASGHLQVVPILLRSRDTAQLYWNAQHVSACSVTGTNGDRWDVAFSGSAGKTSAPILVQTVFTLTCTALPGATPASIQESQTVNVVPVFNEL